MQTQLRRLAVNRWTENQGPELGSSKTGMPFASVNARDWMHPFSSQMFKLSEYRLKGVAPVVPRLALVPTAEAGLYGASAPPAARLTILLWTKLPSTMIARFPGLSAKNQVAALSAGAVQVACNDFGVLPA